MPQYTIETAYRIPVYRQRTYQADTAEAACALALEDDDWSTAREDAECAGDTYVSGLWLGRDAAYDGDAVAIPSSYDEPLRRKVFLFDILLSRLIVLRNTPGGAAQLSVDVRARTDAVIAKGLAVARGLPDPEPV